MSILNCSMGIRRKYSCEQDSLEHLKMSHIFLPICSTPDTEFLCKKKAVVPPKHNVSHQNHPDWTNPWKKLYQQLLIWGVKSHWKAYLFQRPFRTQKHITYLNKAIFIFFFLNQVFVPWNLLTSAILLTTWALLSNNQLYSGTEHKTECILFLN